VRRVTAGAGALLAVLLVSTPAYGDAAIELPTPAAALAQELDLVCNPVVGGLPERCKKSSVPGPVINEEQVLVGVNGDGRVGRVLVEQRLVLTKVGDYVIRERGPARSAVALVKDTDPPNTKFGAVVYQGFTPGNRKLGARLTLDAGLEEARLPLGVTVTYDGGDGPRPLDPGGRVPGAGTVRVQLTNQTTQPAELPSGADAPAGALAGPLDAALRFAQAPPGPRVPSTDTVLPRRLPVTSPGLRATTQSVPLRITGSLRVAGTTGSIAGPKVTPLPDGGLLAGTLTGEPGTVEFTAQVAGAGTLTMDLTVVPTLDPRLLAPPRHLASWAAWARGRPPLAERQAALDLLVTTAATGARASSYSPYLGVDLPGSGSTVFRYGFAPADRVAVRARELEPRPGAIALSGIAVLLLLVNGALIWRRS
jgi:hypothetical protein